MDKRVLVHLQANRKVTGQLRGFDLFLNLVLDDAQDESAAGEKVKMGQTVIRGNSVTSMESLEAIPKQRTWGQRQAHMRRPISLNLLQTTLTLASPIRILHKELSNKPDHPPGTSLFYVQLLISICLVLSGGLFAGLTLGILSLDDLNLKVLETSGESVQEREHARRLLKLLSLGRHWILSVLLLSNSIVNEALPIFLDSILGGGYSAIILSTASIFMFGEIIPQSICARHGLAIGSFFSPLVLVLCYVTSPITYPLSKLLDYVLGSQHDTTYKKAELKSFLNLHRYGVEPLQDDEINIMEACLSLNEKKVLDIMTPIEDVYTLSSDQVVDEVVIDKILHHGYSRIPIHTPNNPTRFIGMLLVKKLIKYDPEDKWRVSDFALSVLPEALPNISCFQALDYFQTGRAHLLVITEHPGDTQGRGVLGVATLEDVLEEILGEEIIDESDRIMDNRSKRRVVRTHQYIKGIYERQKAVRRGSLPESTANSRSDSPVANFRKKLGTSTPVSGAMEHGPTNSTVANMTNEDLVETLTPNADENSHLIKSPVARHPHISTNRNSKLQNSVVGSPSNSDKNNYGSTQ
ncbi:hypothetical protein E3P99_03087 [Wallemia hederae]|uniref:CNNM transmembrane domain-containing protein n=1 Tax=Wallemia hederae TaxID=1540922 RepID=A0A4V4LSR9_9BASI|nr:hypothetical protein E3P99_03087 [Wallemia hederae]